MASAVELRTDYSAADLRRLAAASKDANQSRRLLSLAAVLDGMNRTDAAKIGGMDRQTLRDWVHRLNERGPDGLKDNWHRGNPPRLSAAQQAQLCALVETGPDRAVHGVVRWRRVDLKHVYRRGVRRRLSRADGRQAPEAARLLPHQRQTPASDAGCRDHPGFQKKTSAARSRRILRA